MIYLPMPKRTIISCQGTHGSLAYKWSQRNTFGDRIMVMSIPHAYRYLPVRDTHSTVPTMMRRFPTMGGRRAYRKFVTFGAMSFSERRAIQAQITTATDTAATIIAIALRISLTHVHVYKQQNYSVPLQVCISLKTEILRLVSMSQHNTRCLRTSSIRSTERYIQQGCWIAIVVSV